MPGTWPQHEHPNLTDENCTVTSSFDTRYNCLAWAAGDSRRWWWPDPFGIAYWPPGVPRVETMEALVDGYTRLGFTLCLNNSLEAGMEKIALYGIRDTDGSTSPTHAAKQLPSGEWTSKLGVFEDISHDSAEDLVGPVYGRPLIYMARPRQSGAN